jgi:hypothetical protein
MKRYRTVNLGEVERRAGGKLDPASLREAWDAVLADGEKLDRPPPPSRPAGVIRTRSPGPTSGSQMPRRCLRPGPPATRSSTSIGVTGAFHSARTTTRRGSSLTAATIGGRAGDAGGMWAGLKGFVMKQCAHAGSLVTRVCGSPDPCAFGET